MNGYWRRQGKEPLFPDLLWSRPESKRHAGKLLIIGGQAQEFADVAAAYAAAEKAGAGTIRVLMPESTRKLTSFLPNIEYAPSNQSGSFAKAALSELFDASQWADGVLLPGDLGRNSETTTLIDGYLLRCVASATIADNALESISVPYEQLATRPITLVLSAKNLQKLGTNLGLTEAITSTMGAVSLAEALHEITEKNLFNIVTHFGNNIWVANSGEVVSAEASEIDLNKLTACAAVWTIQNPTKPLEALTTAVFEATNL